jgi:rubrerythrin
VLYTAIANRVELESAKKIFLNIADGTQKHSALLKDIYEAVAKPKRKTKSKAKKLDEVFDVSYSIYKESVYLDGGAKIFVLEFFWLLASCAVFFTVLALSLWGLAVFLLWG